jgi:hypothetical protein
MSEHFLEGHTCIILVLYLATCIYTHIYIADTGSWHYKNKLALLKSFAPHTGKCTNQRRYYKVMIGLIVRPTSTHTYMYRYIFVENFGENEKKTKIQQKPMSH